MSLAAQILSADENYVKNEIIESIPNDTEVSIKEAAKRYKLMVDTAY